MVSNTRSGRNHNKEGHKSSKNTRKVKDVSDSKKEASVSTGSSKGRAGSNKASDDRCSDPRGSSTTNKRRSSRLEKLALSASPVKKNVEQQESATSIPLRRSGRIDHSNSNSKVSKDTANKNRKGDILENATSVGKGGNKKNVKLYNSPCNKRERLNAATYRASFMPLKKKAKSSDISQRLKKVDGESQVARVNRFNDENNDGNFTQDGSSMNAISSSVSKSNKIVESHATHENERADNDLQGQEVSSCNIDQTMSIDSSSEGNTERDSKKEGGAQAENLGNQREISPVRNSCDAVVIPINQAYNADSNLEQNEGILRECVQNSKRKDATEKCLPNSVVSPLTTKEYDADLTLEQDIRSLRVQPHSQGKKSTSRHSSDGMDISLTNRENDHVRVCLELEGNIKGDQLETQRDNENANANTLVATQEDRGGRKTGDNVCVEDLEEAGTKIETLLLNFQTGVTHDVQKQSRTPICCNDCKIGNLSPEKACLGAWHCTCSGKRFESETFSMSKGVKSASDAQGKRFESEEKNCTGGGTKNPVNDMTISSLPVPDVVVSKEQFGRCSYEFKSDLSSSKFLEYWVPVQLSKVQLEQYCSTLISGSAILRMCSRDHIGASGDILVSSRKCCDHPYLVDSSLQGSLTRDLPPAEYLDIGVRASGKLMLLDKILEMIKRQGLRVVILFHQFIGGDVKVTIGDILDDFLHQRFGADSFERVDGGLIMARKQSAMQMFNKKELGRFVFLIENRACLPSIKLSSVDAIIIFGSDWNPLGDLKALHKINIDSQSQQLSIFRLYSSHTLEEKILSFAKQDVILENNIPYISRKCHSLLSSGASHLFDELDTFHKVVSTSVCLKTLHHSSHLDDTVLEILTRLPNSTGSIISNPAIITKAPQTGAAYSRSISLFREKYTKKIDEPPQIFWSQLLDGRHPQWRYITGQSQRHRRKLQQFEEQPQQARDENDDPKRKKRKISLGTMDAVSWQPSTHGKKNEVSTAGNDFSKYCTHEARTDHNAKVSEAPKSESERRKLRTLQKNLHLLLAPEMAKLCDVLQLPDDVKNVAEHFLEYIMNSHHVSQKPETLLQAFKLSLCWRAASFLKYNINHKESLELVKKELRFECSETEAESVYAKLQMLKKKFSLPVNALMKCIQPNNPANPSANDLHDTNKKSLSPVGSVLLEPKEPKEESVISEVHRLPEHLLEQSNHVGQLANSENFHQDKSMKNASSISLHSEKANSSQVAGIVQKQVVGPHDFGSFFQCQQKETASQGNITFCHNASASSNQVHAMKHVGHGFSDGVESGQGKLASTLQHEQLSSCVPVHSLESCLPSAEVERPATIIIDEMENQQVHLHQTETAPVSLQSANSEVNTKNAVSVAETLEHAQHPSSHMHATPSIEPMEVKSPRCPAFPNVATTFQLNDDAPSVVLERCVESDGMDSGQLSCLPQQMATSITHSTDALVVTQPGSCTLSEPVLLNSQLNVVSANVSPLIEQMTTSIQSTGATVVTHSERFAIPDVSETMLLSSQLNVVSATDVSPLIKHSQFVAFDNEKHQEQNSSPSSPFHSLQPYGAADLHALHDPVHVQFLPSDALVSTEHVQAHTFPILEGDQAHCNEMCSTTSSSGILMQNQSGPNRIHSLQDASPNQLFPQAPENQVEEPTDLQTQRDTNGTQILQEKDDNCLIHPIVINARLSSHELQPDPLQNEMLRIRKELDTVVHEFKAKKLHIKGEYESELGKLTRKYDMLFKDVETTYLERIKMLEMIFGKVSMNWLLANEFRSRFSDKAAAAAKPSNLQGQCRGSMPPAQVSTPRFAWSAFPESCMTTPQVTIPNVATSSLPHNPSPALLSGQTQSTASTYVPSVSLLPVQVVHSPSELFSPTTGRPHVVGSMLPPFGKFNVGSGLHRSPAPHLNSFRSSVVSTSSHYLRTEVCGHTQHHPPTSGDALPAAPQSLPSRDAISRTLGLAGDRAIPTPPPDTSCRTCGIPENLPVPTVPIERKQHPENFPAPTTPSPLSVSAATQTLASEGGCIMDDQRPGNSADSTLPSEGGCIMADQRPRNSTDPTLPLPVEDPTMQPDGRVELPEGSPSAPTTHRNSASSCDVDLPITTGDNQESLDAPRAVSELRETPPSTLHSNPESEEVRAEASPALGPNNVVCLSSDEDY